MVERVFCLRQAGVSKLMVAKTKVFVQTKNSYHNTKIHENNTKITLWIITAIFWIRPCYMDYVIFLVQSVINKHYFCSGWWNHFQTTKSNCSIIAVLKIYAFDIWFLCSVCASSLTTLRHSEFIQKCSS